MGIFWANGNNIWLKKCLGTMAIPWGSNMFPVSGSAQRFQVVIASRVVTSGGRIFCEPAAQRTASEESAADQVRSACRGDIYLMFIGCHVISRIPAVPTVRVSRQKKGGGKGGTLVPPSGELRQMSTHMFRAFLTLAAVCVETRTRFGDQRS